MKIYSLEKNSHIKNLLNILYIFFMWEKCFFNDSFLTKLNEMLKMNNWNLEDSIEQK